MTLRIPNGSWRPDTVITDYEGTEMFVLLDQTQAMRSYEAVFGDLEGRRLVCIKRHLLPAFWRDGYYLCTYKPNYRGQKPLADRDVDNKRVYPFSYLQVSPLKGRFYYRVFDNQGGLSAPKLRAENPWLGFMVVCCTPMVRMGKWTASYQRRTSATPTIYVDQWRNCVDVGPGNDLLAALCLAYVFDRYQCQPLVTVFGVGDGDDDQLEADDRSIASEEDDVEKQQGNMQFTNVPHGDDGGDDGGYHDEPQSPAGGGNDRDRGGASPPLPNERTHSPPLPPQYDARGNLAEPASTPVGDAYDAYDEDNSNVTPPPEAWDEFGTPDAHLSPQQQPQRQEEYDDCDEFGNPVEPPLDERDEFGHPISPPPSPEGFADECGTGVEPPRSPADDAFDAFFAPPPPPAADDDEFGRPTQPPDFADHPHGDAANDRHGHTRFGAPLGEGGLDQGAAAHSDWPSPDAPPPPPHEDYNDPYDDDDDDDEPRIV